MPPTHTVEVRSRLRRRWVLRATPLLRLLPRPARPHAAAWLVRLVRVDVLAGGSTLTTLRLDARPTTPLTIRVAS